MIRDLFSASLKRMENGARVDIAVVGGGPAGATLAGYLSQKGYSIALFDKDSFPRDKLCGEFLSTELTSALKKLGCFQDIVHHQPATIKYVRVIAPNAQAITIPLPGDALGLSRLKLDETLINHARKNGVKVFEKSDVRALRRLPDQSTELLVYQKNKTQYRIAANHVVAAFGRRSRLDRTLSRPFFRARSDYIAFKQHHRFRCARDSHHLNSFVELYIFAGGYCGVSMVENNFVNVCTMIDRKYIPHTPTCWKDVATLLSKYHPLLALRLSQLQAVKKTPMQTVAQISLALKERHLNGIFFVGDAASMIAPLAGDGQAMAIESALRLADLMHHHYPTAPVEQWNKEWRRHYESRVRLGVSLQYLLTRPTIAQPIIKLLGHWPAGASSIIKLTRG